MEKMQCSQGHTLSCTRQQITNPCYEDRGLTILTANTPLSQLVLRSDPYLQGWWRSFYPCSPHQPFLKLWRLVHSPPRPPCLLCGIGWCAVLIHPTKPSDKKGTCKLQGYHPLGEKKIAWQANFFSEFSLTIKDKTLANKFGSGAK